MNTFGLSSLNAELPLKHQFIAADAVNREVVVCMSRMFLYENWQVLLTSLEIYRNYRADLLVAYVDSVVTGVFDLLKVYEREGLVMIEPSIKVHYTREMPFDPNRENEWGNQMIVYNHCLYKFRESAEFVVFADWDDALIPRSEGVGMAEPLRSLFARDPQVGAFQLHRMSTTLFAASDPNNFDFKTTLTTMQVSQFFGAGKTVVIPSRVKGAWVHTPSQFEHGYKLGYAKTSDSWFYHLRRLFTYKLRRPDQAVARPNQLNTSEMVQSFADFHESRNLKKIFPELPKRHIYLALMEKCYNTMAHLFHLNSRKQCPNQAMCSIPKTSIRCVNVVHHFESMDFAPSLTISHSTDMRFLYSKTGCIP